jgi:hypothetical protein
VDWQQHLVLLIVAAAAAYLVRLSWRTWTGKGKGCGGRCQCGDTGKSQGPSAHRNLIPVDQLTLRTRPRG